MNQDELKRLVGTAAADRYVRSGMRLGLGTGSTAVWAVRRVGELYREGALRDLLAVATSTQTVYECQLLGIPLRSLNDPEISGELDLTIDGADEVDPLLRLTKGGGGALLIEKIVAYASKRFVAAVDDSKLVKHLGVKFPVPVEVVREARVPVTKALAALGAKVEVRMAVRKMGPVITDNGNILLDIRFPSPVDPGALEREINLIPGVVENGLFTRIAPVVLAGHPDGTVETITA